MPRPRRVPSVPSLEFRVVLYQRQRSLIRGQAQVPAPPIARGCRTVKLAGGVLCRFGSRQPDDAAAPIVLLDGSQEGHEGTGHGSTEAGNRVQDGVGAAAPIEASEVAVDLLELLSEQRVAGHRPPNAQTSGKRASPEVPVVWGGSKDTQGAAWREPHRTVMGADTVDKRLGWESPSMKALLSSPTDNLVDVRFSS